MLVSADSHCGTFQSLLPTAEPLLSEAGIRRAARLRCGEDVHGIHPLVLFAQPGHVKPPFPVKLTVCPCFQIPKSLKWVNTIHTINTIKMVVNFYHGYLVLPIHPGSWFTLTGRLFFHLSKVYFSFERSCLPSLSLPGSQGGCSYLIVFGGGKPKYWT